MNRFGENGQWDDYRHGYYGGYYPPPTPYPPYPPMPPCSKDDGCYEQYWRPKDSTNAKSKKHSEGKDEIVPFKVLFSPRDPSTPANAQEDYTKNAVKAICSWIESRKKADASLLKGGLHTEYRIFTRADDAKVCHLAICVFEGETTLSNARETLLSLARFIQERLGTPRVDIQYGERRLVVR